MASQSSFFAKTDNTNTIVAMLSSIHLRRDIEAYCLIDAHGIRFTVEKGRCMQSNVYMKKELFTRFECDRRHEFGINLSLLLDCLKVLGHADAADMVSLQLSYAGEGRPFLVQMVEGSVVSSSGVQPTMVKEPTDFCWSNSSSRNMIILRSLALREAFAELSLWGEQLEICMQPVGNAAMGSSAMAALKLKATGEQGSCEVELNTACEAVKSADLRQETHHSYRFSLLQPLVKALALSETVCLKVNELGMLHMQLMIQKESAISTFVEFLVCADVED